MLHELGHCVLGRVHDSAIDQDAHGNYFHSLMYPGYVDSATYQEHREYYWKELFQ
jgi:hypothetical protein